VTAVAAPALGTAEEQLAVELLGPLLPTDVRAAGIALIGGHRVSLVRLLDAPDTLVRAVLDLRGRVPGVQHTGWLPHVTLARRLDRADVPTALDALGHADVVLSLTSVRRWDPEAGIVTTL
jgi:hypothetical protein